MLYYIDATGNYFEAELPVEGATEIPYQRPSPMFDWVGDKWVQNDERTALMESKQLEGLQKSKLYELQQAYAAACVADISMTTMGGYIAVFQADEKSQAALQSKLLGNPNSVPEGFYWVASDNAKIPFVREDIESLLSAISNRSWQAFTRLQSKKEEVKKATTPAQVQVILW